MTKIHAFAAFFVLTFIAFPVSAQDILTEESIRAFYKNASQSYRWSYGEYLEFTENSITDDFEAELTVTVHMPQQPPMQNRETLGKQAILRDAQKNYDSMQSAELENIVEKIDISDDGTTATVTDTTRVRNVLLPESVGREPVYMDGGGPCEDTLIITRQGRIQISRSTCEYNYDIRQEQSL
ncbi:MAG: hypothetical protein IT558_04355 [Alphaproteobacteria bacterium]|nr:hypothetical protein [Alphaproteobacteria bacterium]